LDPLADLIGTLEDNLSVPTAIVVDPQGWAQLRKIEDRRRLQLDLARRQAPKMRPRCCFRYPSM
jgi:hypothetical protein